MNNIFPNAFVTDPFTTHNGILNLVSGGLDPRTFNRLIHALFISKCGCVNNHLSVHLSCVISKVVKEQTAHLTTAAPTELRIMNQETNQTQRPYLVFNNECRIPL